MNPDPTTIDDYVPTDRHIEQAAGDLVDDMQNEDFISETLTDQASDRLERMIVLRIRQAITHRDRFPAAAVPSPSARLVKAARWAEQQLKRLVTGDDGDGAFVRSTGVELAGFGAGMEELRSALKDSISGAVTPSAIVLPTQAEVEAEGFTAVPVSEEPKCLDCGLDYDGFGMDTLLPRWQWLLIHPDEGGLLCANCIVKRASKVPGAVGLHATIGIAPPAPSASAGGEHDTKT